MDQARSALAHWPAFFRAARLVPLGSAGGFSGATLWRLCTPAGDFCLRAFPPGATPSPDRALWMRTARDAGLSFVPAIVLTSAGLAEFHHAGRLWELQEWVPGRADFHNAPSPTRLRAACTALAQLHRVWTPWSRPWNDQAPAVRRRLEALSTSYPTPWLARLADQIRRELPAHRTPHTVAPCLCDIWHDHVLFTADEVTGIVDYAAMQYDVLAVDVARLLGSLIGDDEAGWQTGLSAHGLLNDEEVRLARWLDRAAAVVAAIRWQRWLNHAATVPDSDATKQRATESIRRVRNWA